MSQDKTVNSGNDKSTTIAQAIAAFKAKGGKQDDCLDEMVAAVIDQGAKLELPNNCYEHALEYTEKMLSHTRCRIYILTGGACFYAPLLEPLTAALVRIRQSGGSAKMIVASNEYPEWLEALAQEFSGTFTLAKLNLEAPLQHFIVCDSKIVRIEDIHGELTLDSPSDVIKAKVIFNESEKGKELEDRFSSLWSESEINRADPSRKPTAPSWVIQRMEALQQRPPPTSQKMRAQWEASMEFSRRSESKQTVS